MEPAPEKEVCCSQQRWKELEIWRVLLTPDMEIQSLEFINLVFGLAFLVQYFLIITFWNSNIYLVSLHVGSMWSSFGIWFYRWSQLRECLGAQKKTLDLETVLKLKAYRAFWSWTKVFCIMICQNAYVGKGVECGVSNENVPAAPIDSYIYMLSP